MRPERGRVNSASAPSYLSVVSRSTSQLPFVFTSVIVPCLPETVRLSVALVLVAVTWSPVGAAGVYFAETVSQFEPPKLCAFSRSVTS